MRCLTTVYASVVPVLRTLLAQVPAARIMCLTAFGVGLALANSGFGDDNVHDPAALGVLLGESQDAVAVVGVIPDSPAERAGVRLGDEIRYVGDRRIRTTQELTKEIRESKPGTQVDLSIRRSGRRQVITANLASLESTFGKRDLPANSGPGRSGGPVNRASQQAHRSPGPNASTYGLNAGKVRDTQPQVNQRIRALEQQIYRQQHELNELRYSQRVGAHQAFDFQSWWDRQHRGEANDDPALFQ